MASYGAVLKIVCGTEMYRVPLDDKPDFTNLQEKFRTVWSRHSHADPVAKYVDEEGDLCTLIAASFEDFLATARPSVDETAGGRSVLKILLFEPSASDSVLQVATMGHCTNSKIGRAEDPERGCAEQVALETVDEQVADYVVRLPTDITIDGRQHSDSDEESESVLSDYEVISLGQVCEEDEAADDQATKLPDHPEERELDASEQEAMALVEQVRKACEEDLRNHLTTWLASNPDEITYESWIEAVHPENAIQKSIDSRMYLEASFHRQLWNSLAANKSGIEADERRRRYVPPSDRNNSGNDAFDDVGVCSDQVASVDAESNHSGSAVDATAVPATRGRTGRVLLYLRSFMGGSSPVERHVFGPDSAPQFVTQKEPHIECKHQPVAWKDAAENWLAARLPIAYPTLHARMMLAPDLSGDVQLKLRLLSEALRESGSKYEALADAALCLTVERGMTEEAVAKLAALAGSLPREGRLLYARTLIACCPELLVPVVPADLRNDVGPEAAAAARNAARDVWKQELKRQNGEKAEHDRNVVSQSAAQIWATL